MKPVEMSDAQYMHLCEQFGAALRECRDFVGETQVEFAARFGTTDRTICHYERGHGLPRSRRLYMIAKYMGISVDFLFGLSRERHHEQARERAKTRERAKVAAR